MGENGKRNMEGYGFDSEFPKRLRALMENRNEISPLKRNVTQAELARHLGITRQAVSAYTLGTSVPDMLKFKAIADFFHVTYSYLLGASNVLVESHKNFADTAHLPPSTVSAILHICSTVDHSIAFSLLVETVEFYEALISLSSAIELYFEKASTVQADEHTLVKMNADVKKETNGALRVVPIGAEHDMCVIHAEKHFSKAIEEMEKKFESIIKKSLSQANASGNSKGP